MPTPAHAARPAYDIERIRRDFPIIHQTVYGGKPLVYLDNAATSQKPRPVIEAITDYYTRYNANVHRGVHFLSQRATDVFEEARGRVRRFLNAREDAEVVWTRGATEAINLVASAWGDANVREGDEIVISAMEHHSNIVPWQLLCQRRGARLRIAPMNARGELLWDEFERLLNRRTRLVSLVWVSNALGTINPARRIVEAAHAAGALCMLDACQAVQHLPVDIQELDCDFLVFSGHKLYAPTGIGALWARREILEAMPPYQGGGDMIRTVTHEGSTWNDVPFKFEAGTPNIEGAIGLAAAIDYVDAIGLPAIAAHEHAILTHATEVLGRIPGIRFIGTAAEKSSVLSFVVDGIHASDLGTLIDQEGVAVRVGHHCAQPVMDFFKVPGTVRASLGLFNDESDIAALARAIDKALAMRRAAASAPAAPTREESIAEAQENIVAEYARHEGWEDRYAAIIAAGERLPGIDEQYKQPDYIVKGCQSTVYMFARLDGGRVVYESTSDAALVRGLIALLMRVYSNRTPDEILSSPPNFIHKLGLNQNLTQGRANGLAAMIEQIKLYALVLKSVAARG